MKTVNQEQIGVLLLCWELETNSPIFSYVFDVNAYLATVINYTHCRFVAIDRFYINVRLIAAVQSAKGLNVTERIKATKLLKQ